MAHIKPVEHLLLFARRIRGVFTSLRAGLHLLIGIRRRQPQELWIGDSHAVCLNMPLHVAPWSVGAEGQVVMHLGGRLMYTMATRGLPSHVDHLAKVVRRLGKPGVVVPFLCAGEIDVRCHLVPRWREQAESLGFVAGYVDRAVRLAEALGSTLAVVVVPTPQSDSIPQVARYPIRGTLQERVAVTERLREQLHAEVAARTGPIRVQLLDLTDVLATEDGSMRLELTSDGVHTNDRGIALARGKVADLRLAW